MKILSIGLITLYLIILGGRKGYALKQINKIQIEKVGSTSVHALASVVQIGSISESVLQEMPPYLMQIDMPACGYQTQSATCSSLPSPFDTLNSVVVYDPIAHTWTV